jgi:hypothetical protein
MAVTSHWSHDEYAQDLELPYIAHPFSTSLRSDTPASTPGLVDSSLDPFGIGNGRNLSSSTVGSVPPTPELGPTSISINPFVPTLAPAPPPRWMTKGREIHDNRDHPDISDDVVDVELMSL